MPAGDYDALRVTVTAVRVVLDDGTEIDASPPAGPVEVLGFPVITVQEDGSITITLDFPVDVSFQVMGTTVFFSPQITFESIE